ncbi:MAG: hypothetical protein HYY14_02340 [Candidatus Omnitrophica bacterium]|nr:hypothetical protein [Candidatus Omnitrophota bacterium]
MTALQTIESALTSAAFRAEISETDFSGCAATVIGYGHMGSQYVRALRALGVGHIRVISRSPGPLKELGTLKNVDTFSGGYEGMSAHARKDEVGVVAAPLSLLPGAVEKLVLLGFRRLLIEKPVALSSSEIDALAVDLEEKGVEAYAAYNRVVYPSVLEARARAGRDGGITSCFYTFTEMIKPDWPDRFSATELSRWGIANSMHVISLAHRLIGMPSEWKAHRAGSLSWHPSGSVFVGSGRSEQGIPFAYHADWGSKGRWSVEIHTSAASYCLCPLEKLFQKTAAQGGWEPVPVKAFEPHMKAGVLEEVAASLKSDIAPLVTLREAARLTRYAEDILGYSDHG